MWGLRIVPDRCTGCLQCELACSWVQTGTFQPSRAVIRVQAFEEQASYGPYTCFQCAEAWCMSVCPVNAIAIHPVTGAKVVLPETCVGCALCTIACPFGTVFWDPMTHRAFKCDLCAGDPACVRACPTEAIRYEPVETADWVEPWSRLVTERLTAIPAGSGQRGR